jgi:hypothetical protein
MADATAMVATDKWPFIIASSLPQKWPVPTAISKLRRSPSAAPADGTAEERVFEGGEVMLLAPFRAGPAHVMQLGAIGIKNPRRPFRERRAETVPHFTRQGADERQFSGDSGTGCHYLESHLFPLPFWPKGI